jgi:pyruvate kinase
MNEAKIAKYQGMIQQVEELIESALKMEEKYAKSLAKVHPSYERSARNLLHYWALRQHDIRTLQKQLGNLGLSRLAKAENHIMASLVMTRSILRGFIKAKRLKNKRPGLSIKDGRKLINRHSKELLGNRSKKRRTRIMVTMPSIAAEDENLVLEMVKSGMNTARINCAHDHAEVWEKMIGNVKKAMERVSRTCKITMDLAGPKIRTGAVVLGPQVVKLRTKKDSLGEVTQTAKVWFGQKKPPDPDMIHLPVKEGWAGSLEEGDQIAFRDTRNKKRSMIVTQKTDRGVVAESDKNAYIQTGTVLILERENNSLFTKVEGLPSVEQSVFLKEGDTLILHKSSKPGESAIYDEAGNLKHPAHISCTSHEIFTQAKKGEKILFDDGKLGGEIKAVDPEKMSIKITYTPPGGAKLKADKGINFPKSNLSISGLTQKDREDLKFVVKYADVVNMSFVNQASDVEDLLAELRKHDAVGNLGIILKIETRQAFDNLLEILLTSMQTFPVGVMIARGDLAIETGWDKIGFIQEEILWLCQAAHIPNIWATQVLENLAKKGMPSRAEITDATMAQRAECVMLNKGPYITRAIGLLDTIFRKMEKYQEKNMALTPPMGSYRRWG